MQIELKGFPLNELELNFPLLVWTLLLFPLPPALKVKLWYLSGGGTKSGFRCSWGCDWSNNVSSNLNSDLVLCTKTETSAFKWEVKYGHSGPHHHLVKGGCPHKTEIWSRLYQKISQELEDIGMQCWQKTEHVVVPLAVFIFLNCCGVTMSF